MTLGYKDIIKMRVWIGGYFGPINYVDLDFTNSIVTHNESKMLEDDQLKTNFTFNKDVFLKNIEKLDLLNWEEEYVNDSVLDGTQWYIHVQFKNNKKIEISGSNAYPENYERLLRTISKIVNKKFN